MHVALQGMVLSAIVLVYMCRTAFGHQGGNITLTFGALDSLGSGEARGN